MPPSHRVTKSPGHQVKKPACAWVAEQPASDKLEVGDRFRAPSDTHSDSGPDPGSLAGRSCSARAVTATAKQHWLTMMCDPPSSRSAWQAMLMDD